MLIYEKWVTPEKEDGGKLIDTSATLDEGAAELERKLFGAENNIPSDNDPEVTYKDGEGSTVDDVSAYKYFYEKGKKIFASTNPRQVPNEEEDIELSAWVGDECIAGDAGEDDGGGSEKSADNSTKAPMKSSYVDNNSDSEFTVTYTKPRYVNVEPKSGATFKAGDTAEFEMSVSEDRVFADTPSVSVNDVTVDVFETKGGYGFAFVVEGDTTVKFTVHTTATNNE